MPSLKGVIGAVRSIAGGLTRTATSEVRGGADYLGISERYVSRKLRIPDSGYRFSTQQMAVPFTGGGRASGGALTSREIVENLISKRHTRVKSGTEAAVARVNARMAAGRPAAERAAQRTERFASASSVVLDRGYTRGLVEGVSKGAFTLSFMPAAIIGGSALHVGAALGKGAFRGAMHVGRTLYTSKVAQMRAAGAAVTKGGAGLNVRLVGALATGGALASMYGVNTLGNMNFIKDPRDRDPINAMHLTQSLYNTLR